MRAEISKLHQRVMKDGVIQQVGTPKQVYDHPDGSTNVKPGKTIPFYFDRDKCHFLDKDIEKNRFRTNKSLAEATLR